MKSILAISLLLFSLNSSADPFGDHPDYDNCSVESKAQTVSALESHLKTIVKDNQLGLAENTIFTDFIKKQEKIKDVDKKLKGYREILGLDKDPNSKAGKEELAEFIGARDHSSYILSAESSLNLNSAQANFLVVSIRGSIIKAATKNEIK